MSEGFPLLGGRRGAASSPTAADTPASRTWVDWWLLISFSVSAAAFIGFASWVSVDMSADASRRAFVPIATRLASVFMFASLPISFYDIFSHLAHYEHRVQRFYVRVLLLPPIYAIESYLALQVPNAHFFLETLRESYECIALLAVFRLACETLGSRDEIAAILSMGAANHVAKQRTEHVSLVEGIEGFRRERSIAGGLRREASTSLMTATSRDVPLLAGAANDSEPASSSALERFIFSLIDGSAFSCSRGKREHGADDSVAPDGSRSIRLIVPFCCLGFWRADLSFLARCEWGVAQYVVIRIMTSVVTVVLQAEVRWVARSVPSHPQSPLTTLPLPSPHARPSPQFLRRASTEMVRGTRRTRRCG